MSNGHGSSRRQAYGRRMKDLRTRRGEDIAIDLDGPNDWSRGSAWEEERSLHTIVVHVDQVAGGARPR